MAEGRTDWRSFKDEKYRASEREVHRDNTEITRCTREILMLRTQTERKNKSERERRGKDREGKK